MMRMKASSPTVAEHGVDADIDVNEDAKEDAAGDADAEGVGRRSESIHVDQGESRLLLA